MEIPKKLRIAVSLTAEKILVPPLEFLYWAMGYPKTLFVVLWVAVVSTVTVFLMPVFDMPFRASALLGFVWAFGHHRPTDFHRPHADLAQREAD
ncbi:hypothetical protein [Mycobacteroides abscessus]|uniref:hypothetical protein n=1 Tax=Mycobacteroides abscessus TaxID=36809 RepID=UPI00078D61E8|nr:hypothetical protein [Mycobacteroides abscessus]AMU20893.1 hypothetical protein A3N95_08805 [Mycobacteroides abscessus]